jgi:hypothetical protein
MAVKQKSIKYDRNNDSVVNESEIQMSERIAELELKLSKADAQKRMAWVAMLSMVAFTALIYWAGITDDRAVIVVNALNMFYIAQVGIVSAYFGTTTWMSIATANSTANTTSSSSGETRTD